MTTDRGILARIVGEPHGGRFASLEGYRAIAALSVVLYHTRGNLSPLGIGSPIDAIENLGNFGVAVFFLLSGFLLYLPVTRRLFTHQSQAPVGQFLLRRFVRIFPAYWLALVAWAAIITRPNKELVTPWKVFLLFDGGINTLAVAWTLVIELWFYVAIALLSVVLPRIFRRCHTSSALLRAQFAMLGLMVIVAYVYRVYATQDLQTMVHRVNWIFAYLDWFAFGMAMAILVAWTEVGGQLPASLRGLVDREWSCYLLSALCYGAVLYVIRVYSIGESRETRLVYLVHQAIQPMAAFWLLVPATLGNSDQRVQRLLRRPTLAALGTISYGIYLWHTLVIRLLKRNPVIAINGWNPTLQLVVNLSIVVGIAVVIATLSYRLVERPALTFVPSTFEGLVSGSSRPSAAPPQVVGG